MPIFIYSAAKQNGEVIKGVQEAESKNTLVALLKSEGLFLLDARERGEKDTSFGRLNFNLNDVVSKIRPISIVEKMFFTRNLSVMIEAGRGGSKKLDFPLQ